MKRKIVRKKRNVKKRIKNLPKSRQIGGVSGRHSLEGYEEKLERPLGGDPFRAAEIDKNNHFFEKLHCLPQQVLIPTGGVNTRGELGTAPAHYAHGKITPWEVIKDWKLDYFTGNALKYVCRHEHKGKPIEDIQKAIDCLVEYKNVLNEKPKRILMPRNGVPIQKGDFT